MPFLDVIPLWGECLSRVLAVEVVSRDAAWIRILAGGNRNENIALDGSGKHAEKNVINMFACRSRKCKRNGVCYLAKKCALM